MSERRTPPRSPRPDGTSPAPAGAWSSPDDDAVMRRIDRLLVRWPEAGRSPAEWKDSADAIVSSLESKASVTGAPAVRDEDLLRSPLPASLVEMQRDDGERDGTFAAKDRDDSGMIVLSELMAGAGHTAVGPAHADGSPPAAATVRKVRRTDAWIAFGGAIAGAAVAAGVFFGVQRARRDAVVPSATTATRIGPGASETAVARPGPVEAATLANPAAIDPTRLPIAASDDAHEAASASSSRPGTAAARAVGPARPSAGPSQPASSGRAAETAAAAAPAAEGATGLGDLMRQAAGVAPGSASGGTTGGATDSPSSEVDPSSVPRKPSQGAIQGAIGMVLPAARMCLGPDDPISRATITFKSDGSVENVSISGGALGKPAEACVRAALMKAHVPPFAQPIFTAPATVRPD
jgi:hypothetical protein